MQRGQTAIEFIFLILIIVIYLFTVTRPVLESTQSAFDDIQTVIKTNNETQKVVSSILRVNNFSDNSKETLLISLPEGGTIICHEDGNIEMQAKINSEDVNPQIAKCSNNSCDKNFFTTNNTNCNISQIRGAERIIIEKTSSQIYVKQG